MHSCIFSSEMLTNDSEVKFVTNNIPNDPNESNESNEPDELDDFFEGTEKRMSIYTTNCLTNFPQSYWKILIKKIGCNVINIIENSFYVFFLLEESSFLLGKNYAMLKTCGKTRPILLLNDICKEENFDVLSFKYSHVEFLQPELQDHPYKSIDDEYNSLCEYFVNANVHTILKQTKQPKQAEQTNKSEWFCCQVGNNHENFYELVCWKFEWNVNTHVELKNLLNSHFAPNISTFETSKDNTIIFDEKCFIPYGYSLNMLFGNTYLTIHVTPQKSCSYLSVETNCDMSAPLLFDKIIYLISASDYSMHTPDDYNLASGAESNYEFKHEQSKHEQLILSP